MVGSLGLANPRKSKVSLIVVVVCSLTALHFVVVLFIRRRASGWRLHSLVAGIGALFMVFYITVTSTVLEPLQCQKHPNTRFCHSQTHIAIPRSPTEPRNLETPKSGTKNEPKPKLLSPDIFRWGRGLPHEGVGAKKFGMPLETREIKLFWRDIPGYPGGAQKV